MKESDFRRLQRIKKYCIDIDKSIKRFGSEYDTFNKDKDYFNSVSMSIMQIGELSKGLSDEFKERTKMQIQWGAIRGMRNLFAHTYASMSKKAIWETAKNDIPGLLAFCNREIENYKTNNKESVLDNLQETKKLSKENPAREYKNNKTEQER